MKVFIMKNNKYLSCVKNGKKGGRPDVNQYISTFIIPEINTVILTEHQYYTLVERYGFTLFHKALKILDNWLQSSPLGEKYKGKNNYAHFRNDGWVINEARMEN